MKNNICNSETNKKTRYDNIDLLKTIAIFMVILLHIPVYNTNFMDNYNWKLIIQYSFRLISEGVLIFIFVNGFLLLNKPFDYKKHIKKIFKIFFLMLFWGTMQIIIKRIIRGEELSFLEIIRPIFMINVRNSYCGSLWFLQSLICLYIFFPILKYIHDSNKNLYKYVCVTIIFFSVGINLFSLIIQLIVNAFKIPFSAVMILNNFNNINLYSDNLGMFGFYFILGGFIFEHKHVFERKENAIKAFSIGIISWILAVILGIIMLIFNKRTFSDSYNYSQIFMAITIVGMYALSTFYVNKNENIFNRMITSIGKNTLGIYLIHTLITEIIKKYINITYLNFAQRLYIAFIVLIISWFISLIFSKMDKINTLFKI